ncbi:MAG TPA: cupin domain-containing protein [Armatimonadota bacterium]|nr:cupin domain-containing protein [Armatimonadota bacterium]
MQVIDPDSIQPQAMEMEGAQGVTMRVLIGPEQRAPTFIMRMFEVAPGGNTPMHSHDWEHEVFILDGEGELAAPDSRLPLRPGVAAMVAPGETHQFVNTGESTLRFLCVIPVQTRP